MVYFYIQDTCFDGEYYLSGEMHSVYSTAPDDWDGWLNIISRTLPGRDFYLSAEMQSVYYATPADWA